MVQNMVANRKKTRCDIVEAANILFYHHGYEHTSFADIAENVKISRGNFYYHFKTKDEILDAVIALRLAETRSMIAQWTDQSDAPKERIRHFINILKRHQSKILLYGCPVGSLTLELAKLNHPAQKDAQALFSVFRHWLCQQFTALGHGENADKLALDLLVWSQGVATLASAFQDEAILAQEVAKKEAWLEQIKPGFLEKHRSFI